MKIKITDQDFMYLMHKENGIGHNPKQNIKEVYINTKFIVSLEQCQLFGGNYYFVRMSDKNVYTINKRDKNRLK